MKNINIYYFDNEMGDFDAFNPRFVMEKQYVKEIITLLSKKQAYYYNTNMLVKKLNIDKDLVEKALLLLFNISAVKVKNEKLRLNFPFFTAKDINVIDKIIKNNLLLHMPEINNTFNKLQMLVKDIYPNINCKLSLYHLVCGKIFDGEIFDFLENKNLLKQTFEQKNDRDYMIIGYENSYVCNKLNKKLFCSFNHAKYNGNSLSSFGNAEGFRFDYFRYYQLRKINKIYGKFKLMHNFFRNIPDKEITYNSLSLLNKIYKNEPYNKDIFYKMLQKTKYINKNDEIIVPIFENFESAVKKINDFIVDSMGDIIINSFNEITSKIFNANISCINHQVNKDQICNEIWHIYFGRLNEFLINKKIVAKPQRFLGEGKYLKCIYLSEDSSSI